jgi:uncharacterized glyoxalase superfamily protein PhnB
MNSDSASSAPAGWPTVIPRLLAVDAHGLVTFIKQVFGAAGAYRDDRPAEMNIGGSIIMVTDAGAREPATGFLYVYVEDADETYRKALAAGARSLEEPADMAYGDRRGMVQDSWGNTWQIATRTRKRSGV